MDIDQDSKMDDLNQVSVVTSTIEDGSVRHTQKITTSHNHGVAFSTVEETKQALSDLDAKVPLLEDTLDDVDASMNDFIAGDLDSASHISESQLELNLAAAQLPGVPELENSLAGSLVADAQQQDFLVPNSTSPRLSLLETSTATIADIEENSASSTESFEIIETTRSSLVPSVVIYRAPDPKLPYSSKRTGLVYDPRMRFHTELGATEDDIHPEDPRRIWEIYSELRSEGLIENYDQHSDLEEYQDGHKPQRLLKIDARLAEAAEVCLVHTQDHWRWVESLEAQAESSLKVIGKGMDSVYLHPMTHFCARLSAGGCIEAARAVVTGIVKNAIAVIRPPGHHAEHNEPGGFCFFNNVCVATRVVQNDFPDLCRKVLILDWDVHHGNGIQNIFEDDPNVLYISLHVYKDGKFYPNSTAGDHLHVGVGPGEGRNINIPWPQHHMRDGDYLYAFQQIVMPVAQEFDPDLVIIAAGFDAAEGDQLGMCHVSPEGFAHMTHMLMSLADGRVLAALEGGYNLRSIARSAAAVTKTLMGEPPGRLTDLEPSLAGVATTKIVIDQHSKYWKCLFPKETPEARVKRMQGERLHDIYRENQMLRWFSKFKMSPLCISRDRLSRSFENQVLATDDFAESKPLLIIFHDPPETMNLPDADSSGLEPHNIVINDVAQSYVQQAIENGLSVIDVNVPAHLTAVEENTENGDYRTSVTNEVATYIWENYVEVNDHNHIFLLGIGSAAFAMIHVLNSHGLCTFDKGSWTPQLKHKADSTNDSVSLAASFVAQNILLGVSRPADDFFPAWYYTNSVVWVAENHGVWSPDRQRKLRKKYGKLEKSPQTSINDMLVEHRDEFFAKIAKKIAPSASVSQEPLTGLSNQEILIPPTIAQDSSSITPGLVINGTDEVGLEQSYASNELPPSAAIDSVGSPMEGVVSESASQLAKSLSPAIQEQQPDMANITEDQGGVLQQSVEQPHNSTVAARAAVGGAPSSFQILDKSPLDLAANHSQPSSMQYGN